MINSKDQILLIDLAKQQKQIRKNIDKAIARVLDHGKYIMGPEVFNLEEQLSQFLGVKHSICCSSGTDALLMSLMAKGIGPGDAVFTTPFSFMATAEVISLLGAVPVFVDVDPQTWNMDPKCLEKAIDALTHNSNDIYPIPQCKELKPIIPKAVIPVDIFGLPADYDRIMAIAEKNSLFVLEDSAQSFGAEYKDKKAGNLAHAAATSFFPAKPLGCYGDGGAVFTNDDQLASKIRSIRVHGKGEEKYDNIRIGINGRLDTIQAAVLLEKLKIFEQEVMLRNQVAAQYKARLSPYFTPQTIKENYNSVWAQFSVLHSNRQKLISHLDRNKIHSAVYYPKPLHCQTAYSWLGYKPKDFPVSQNLSETIFSLPMHPYLEEKELNRICKILLEVH